MKNLMYELHKVFYISTKNRIVHRSQIIYGNNNSIAIDSGRGYTRNERLRSLSNTVSIRKNQEGKKMKEFFDDIMGKINKTAGTVGDKVDEVVEIQKVKAKIRTLEQSNKKDLKNLGVIIYEKYKNEEMVDIEFTELCEEIEKREQEIKEYEKELKYL